MKYLVNIEFENRKHIEEEPTIRDFGLLLLENGLSFNLNNGILYKQKGNVLCGEDITNRVVEAKIIIRY